MEARQKEALVNALLTNVVNSDDTSRAVPVAKGDTFTFVLSENLVQKQTSTINGATVEWSGVVDKDGNVFSTRQITRRRNGLPLSGNTEGERMRSFFELFDENDTLKVKVKDIRQREFTNTNDEGKESKSTSNYYIFAVIQRVVLKRVWETTLFFFIFV